MNQTEALEFFERRSAERRRAPRRVDDPIGYYQENADYARRITACNQIAGLLCEGDASLDAIAGILRGAGYSIPVPS